MKHLKVLSIDWDYFVDLSINDRDEMFPDGGSENLSMSLQNIVWAHRYRVYPIESVKVDRPALAAIRRILSRQQNFQFMVADSHRHIYEFIVNNLKEGQEIDLYNIDFHHDVYNLGNEDVDCGNWLRILQHEYIVNANWISREDSDTDDIGFWDKMPIISMKDLEVVSESFDLIFICRSSMWSPPHLDLEFIRLISSYKNKPYAVKCPEPWVYENRYSSKFKVENPKMSFGYYGGYYG